jgi:selenocysteine-specific elongation factor
MVAGATGIHASLLVVNAREGVKPQTVEHVAIADLVGVRRGVVAVTKADLVEPAQRAEVRQRVRAFLRGTHLEFAPLVFTSVASGEGLPELRQALAGLLEADSAGPVPGRRFWLPVDRVFTLSGHGTVVTGTLRGGALRVGDTIECMPRGLTGGVRQLQVHNEVVDEALPGQRVGVNLRHIASADLMRGDVIAPPEQLRPNVLVDVDLRLLPAVQAQDVDGRRVRLLFGTAEVPAMVRMLGRAASNECRWLAQLRSARPLVALPGEPFILRRESPAQTLGGGRILDAAARRHPRADTEALERLRILAGGSSRQRLEEILKTAGVAGLPLAAIAERSSLAGAQLMAAVQGFAFVQDVHLWHQALVDELLQRIVDSLGRHHAAHPLRAGAPLSVCRGALPAAAGERLYRGLLERLVQQERIVQRHGQAWLAGHDPLQSLDAAARQDLLALAAMLRDGGMNPPDPPCTSGPAGPRPLLDLLVSSGEVLLLRGQPPAQKIALHRDAVARAQEELRAAFPPPSPFTVSKARELLRSTRKFTVPLLEHLHATGQTQRRGDLHVFVATPSCGGE